MNLEDALKYVQHKATMYGAVGGILDLENETNVGHGCAFTMCRGKMQIRNTWRGDTNGLKILDFTKVMKCDLLAVALHTFTLLSSNARTHLDLMKRELVRAVESQDEDTFVRLFRRATIFPTGERDTDAVRRLENTVYPAIGRSTPVSERILNEISQGGRVPFLVCDTQFKDMLPHVCTNSNTVVPRGCEDAFTTLKADCPYVAVKDGGNVLIMNGMLKVTRTLGHTKYVTSIVFSPNGMRIVTGSHDRTVRIWDAYTGECVLGPLAGHQHWVTSVAYSADGRRVVSRSADKAILIWDAETGKILQRASGTDPVAISRDGARLASGGNNHTNLCIRRVAAPRECVYCKGHTSFSLAFSPNGLRLVSGSRDKTVRIWNVTSGECVLGPLEHNAEVRSVAFSSDGMRVVSGASDGTVSIWNATSGQVLQVLKGHTESVGSVAFSLDDECVVSGSSDKTMRVWDVTSGECLRVSRASISLESVAFTVRARAIER